MKGEWEDSDAPESERRSMRWEFAAIAAVIALVAAGALFL